MNFFSFYTQTFVALIKIDLIVGIAIFRYEKLNYNSWCYLTFNIIHLYWKKIYKNTIIQINLDNITFMCYQSILYWRLLSQYEMSKGREPIRVGKQATIN